jgi:hypothetical protein
MIHASHHGGFDALCGARRGQSVALGGRSDWAERKARREVTCPECRASLSRRGPKPAAGVARSERLLVRLTPGEREACENRAFEHGVPLGTWARLRLLATRGTKKPPTP